MKMDDRQFESFLREFEPREPGALPEHVSNTPEWGRRLLAAAVVILGLGISAWFATRWPHLAKIPGPNTMAVASSVAPPAAPPLSILQLTRLAQEEPEQLNAAMDAASRNLLPKFQGKDSTLAPLAKE
jgi:hypothetical protein